MLERGFFSSREKAKAAVMAGLVFVDGRISDKAGTATDEDALIELKSGSCPYVSRGGLKLAKALCCFGINVEGLCCIDIGASTGGFTDCLLQNGAARVYAVDVGYGQLAYSLRQDKRVVCMEKINFRYMKEDDIPEKPDFACADVSFISLKLMFPVVSALLKDDGSLVCLIKPQFEAGREQVGKNGIVKDAEVHKEVIEKVLGFARDNGLYPRALSFSPVTGSKGNIEFLLYLSKIEEAVEIDTAAVVSKAHAELSLV